MSSAEAPSESRAPESTGVAGGASREEEPEFREGNGSNPAGNAGAAAKGSGPSSGLSKTSETSEIGRDVAKFSAEGKGGDNKDEDEFESIDGNREKFEDPNPHPPPLVEEIEMFRKSCWLRLMLCQAKLSRRSQGPPGITIGVEFQHLQDETASHLDELGIPVHAFFESRGYRPYMEDRYIATRIMDGDAAFFAVLDGHGLEGEGHLVAEFASKNLANIVERHLRDATAIGPNGLASSSSGLQIIGTSQHISEARNLRSGVVQIRGDRNAVFKEKFDRSMIEVDNRVRRLLPSYAEQNGTTLTSVLVDREHIVFANLGDSRAALLNEDYTIEFVTLDHKPNMPTEVRRIETAGGYIDDYRVNGDLAVSRTLGDVFYKPNNAPRRQCVISNEPDVTLIPRQSRHRCILLASDGLWDAMSTTEVAQVFENFELFKTGDENALRKRTASAFRKIMRDVIFSRLSSDNVTLLFFILDPMERKEAEKRASVVSTTSEDFQDSRQKSSSSLNEEQFQIELT